MMRWLRLAGAVAGAMVGLFEPEHPTLFCPIGRQIGELGQALPCERDRLVPFDDGPRLTAAVRLPVKSQGSASIWDLTGCAPGKLGTEGSSRQ